MSTDFKSEQAEARDSGEFKVHYHLDGGVHRMDALVRNRAEGELLALLKEVGAVLGLPVHVETEAYGEGGLVEFLNLIFQNKEQIGFVMAVLGPLLASPFYLDKYKQSKQQTQLNELNLQKFKLEIKEKEVAAAEREGKKSAEAKNEVLPLEAMPTPDAIAQALLTRKKIARRRSNFYVILLIDAQIGAVGFVPSHRKDAIEHMVNRGNFADFVIATSDLEPLVYEHIALEIVSPVLRPGSIKWRGLFEKKVVSFELQDQAFRSEVVSQNVQFQNGTTLICDFEVHQREDDTGEIEVTGYSVTKVHDVKTPPAPVPQRTEEQLRLPLPAEPDNDIDTDR
jgi:rRNA processing protein Gar1